MFVGTTDFGAGNWVGVKFDAPLGKNNGTVKDRTYFICEPNHGSFVRPSAISIVTARGAEATEL
jgi:dynactin complex subunit